MYAAAAKAARGAAGVRGTFVRAPAGIVARREVPGLSVLKLARFLALDRPGYYWSRPVVGTTDLSPCREAQFLLCERTDGRYALVLPLVDGDVRATLRGGPGATVTVVIDGAAPGAPPAPARVLYTAVGDDPFALVADGIRAVVRELGTFRPRADKRTPAFMDHLGWCTWDAFYHDVSEAKVLAGLRSFDRGGVRPGFVILDDGWLDRTGDHLNDFPPDRAKFPRGLRPMIDAAKARFGVKLFGVWHAFQGYWAGLNPDGPLAARYRTVRNRGDIRPWRPAEIDLHLVHPDDAYRFYHDFHRYLREQGADLVKVDGQSATEVFTHGVLGRGATMRAMQHALQGSVQTHFEGNVIHCMSNGSDVAYNLLSTAGWRNSDDYFPKRPESHGAHVYQNAMNAVWASQFAWPDWDMFWSGHPEGAYHAAARAVSGGPVYVSDRPGKQDFAVLRKLVTGGGRVLRCAQPALPARDALFTDPLATDRLLKIVNRNGDIGVIGLFHCRHDGGPITGGYSPADVHLLPGAASDRVVAYHHTTGEATPMRRCDRREVTLGRLGFELVTISPVVGGFAAPLGLIDKYNGSAAIARVEPFPDRAVRVSLTDGGRFGCWCASTPRKVAVGGKRVRGKFDRRTGLLTLDIPPGGPVEVVVFR